MANRIAFLIFCLIWGGQHSASAEDVYIFTESYPPFNYRHGDGSVGGQATDLVRKVLDESGLTYKITIVPWARAVRYTETADNTLIYSIARLGDREKRFTWLVPLARDDMYLFASTANKRPLSLDMVQAGQIRVACSSDDPSCHFLDVLGIPKSAITQAPHMDRTACLKLVEAGRVDLYPAGLMDYNVSIEHQGFARNSFRPAVDMGLDVTLYLAGSAFVRPSIKEAISSAYERLKTKGTFQMLDSAPYRPED